MAHPFVALAPPPQPRAYARRRPETTALYEIIRDNIETLYGAVEDTALGVKIPKHARKELEGFLDCGLLCRGFARLRCGQCPASLTVAFSCKGRGFCPSCMGRRMCATAAHLIEDVLPEVALRQWVLTFPYAWRGRLAWDGALLSTLTRLFIETVSRHYSKKGGKDAKTGAISVVQRTSSDLRLNPHVHAVLLNGWFVRSALRPAAGPIPTSAAFGTRGRRDGFEEHDGELVWRELPHLTTEEVGQILEAALRRMEKYLRKHGILPSSRNDAGDDADAGTDEGADQEANLAASAVSGRTPPAGPQWQRGLQPLVGRALNFDKHLCASLDGFTLHAATRVGAQDAKGREKLLRYVLRPAVAQDSVEILPNGLVRKTLKQAFADGTVAVEMDPLSFITRLAASVPPPRFHLVKYAGVLASAHKWRSRIAPKKPDVPPASAAPLVGVDDKPKRKGAYRTWAQLLARTFSVDVLCCQKCGGRMRLVAMVTCPRSIRAYLEGIGEWVDVPEKSPARGPPYWRSTVLRRKALGDVA